MRLRFLGDAPLFFIVVKNPRPLLRAAVSKLPVWISRVYVTPEDV